MLWSDNDLEWLKENYDTLGPNECATILGRNSQSVKHKAFTLKLKAPKLNKAKTHEDYEQDLFNREINYFPVDRYVNAITKIRHECLNGHIWQVTPNHILTGYGCPECAKQRFNINKPAILYYIKITKDNLCYFKIGITNQTIRDRFSKDRDKLIEILDIEEFEQGRLAYKKEQQLLLKYSSLRVHVPDFLNSRGNTELFETDILKGKL